MTALYDLLAGLRLAASTPATSPVWPLVVAWLAPACVVLFAAAVWHAVAARRRALKRAGGAPTPLVPADILPTHSTAVAETLAPAGGEPMAGVLYRRGRRGWTLTVPFTNARPGSPLAVTVPTQGGPVIFYSVVLGTAVTDDGTRLDIQRPVWLERSDRRKHARRPVNLHVAAWLSRTTDTVATLTGATMVDVSPTGCRLHAITTAARGDRLDLRFTNLRGDITEVRAAVVECQATGTRRGGHWLRCVFVQEPSLALAHLLEDIPAA